MSKKIFTEQEILELSKNKYVKNINCQNIKFQIFKHFQNNYILSKI